MASTALTEPISASAINVPAEMVLQLAAGMEEPFAVAERFGFSQEQFAQLAQWEPFRLQVEQKRAELKQSGATFRMTMAWMAEDLGKDIYVIAKSNEVTLPQKLDTFKTFSKLADLEPKPNSQSVAAGSGFQINIVFNDKKDAQVAPVEKVVAEVGVKDE